MGGVLGHICLLLPINARWKFKKGKLSVEREKSLMGKSPFLLISKRIIGEMKNIQFEVEDGETEAKKKKRPVFSFDISRETFDLFFNGSQGYRAHFYLGIRCGLNANRSIIRILQNKLLLSVGFSESDLTKEKVKKSMSYPSAKIWICEKTSSIDQESIIPDEIQYLDIPEWVDAMYDTTIKYSHHQLADPLKKLALLGVQTPEGNRLKVFGAWVDENGEEFIAPSKVNRAEHIHMYGFS